MAELTQHPFYEEAQYRSGILYSREPQSWIRSLLFLGMSGGLILGLSRAKFARYRYAVITVLVALIVLNQQVIHGVILFFSSHYLSSMILAGVTCLLLGLWVRSRPALISSFCALVFLTGIAYDGRYVLKQFRIRDHRFGEQHLSTLLSVLDELPRSRILSDRGTSLFIASHTYHDVLYSIYLKNVLMSDKEFAERYCLVTLPLKERGIEDEYFLLYFEHRGRSDEIRQRELKMVWDACARVDANPQKYLQIYGVDYLLWDEKRQPKWHMSPFRPFLVEKGEGWSLWKV